MRFSDLIFSKKFLALAVVTIGVMTFIANQAWSGDAFTGEIRQLTWESRHAAEPAKGDKANAKLLSMISLGAALVPEPMLMQFAQSGGQAMGLGSGQAEGLQKLLTDRYAEITKDPRFATVPSLISYCFSPDKPTEGKAVMFVPEGADTDTPAILFLHGFGGSFQFYPHFFARNFPDHLIIFPAHGITTVNISADYLTESLEAAATELGFVPDKPTLVGLSAGGFGGFREYARHPDRYRGFICLAAYPPQDAQPNFPATGIVRVLAGADEPFVENDTLNAGLEIIRRRGAKAQALLLPGADHFFLLSEEEKSAKILRVWLEDFRTR